MRWTTRLRGLAVAAICLTLSTPVQADIKAFNAAMQTQDYKAAAAEAAATWPTLKRERKDLAVIAREFGFAAYLAGDYAAARTYGEAAVSAGTALGEDPEQLANSNVLFRLASLKAAASNQSRDDLFDALVARATYPGVDLITFYGLDTVVTRDFETGDWKRGSASAALGETVSAEGGGAYFTQALRFGLFKGVAHYMDTKKVDALRELNSLRIRAVNAINGAATDADAQPLIDFYWGLEAWRISISSHLSSRAKLPEADREDPDHKLEPNDRAARLLNIRRDTSCLTELTIKRPPTYPSEALYEGMIGTVLVRLDLDDKGQASNPSILAAVPKDTFGKVVLRSAPGIVMKPGKNWGPDCVLAKQGKVITFIFTIR
jgi:Gram-negative bacterial TonB protein C-terminal